MPSIKSATSLTEDHNADMNILVSPRHRWYHRDATGESNQVPFETASPLTATEPLVEPLHTDSTIASVFGLDFFNKLPGLLIAVLLNLFLSISF
jgi:hypothetical protein